MRFKVLSILFVFTLMGNTTIRQFTTYSSFSENHFIIVVDNTCIDPGFAHVQIRVLHMYRALESKHTTNGVETVFHTAHC